LIGKENGNEKTTKIFASYSKRIKRNISTRRIIISRKYNCNYYYGEISPDLSVARIYLSLFNSENKEQLLTEIKSQTKEIRYKLGERIRNQARIVPHLEFFLDDSMEYVSRMDQLFNKINKEKEEGE
jgi:ribosome-binding factor A